MAKPGALWWSKSSPVLTYGVAVLSVAGALAAGRLADIYLHTDPFVSLFLCAILLAAWFGGAGPGLLAAVLAILAFDYYFVEPNNSFALAATEVPRLVLFALVALFVVALSSAQRRAAGSLRRARDDLQAAVQELERLNKALHIENAERHRAEQQIRKAERELQVTIDTIPVMAASYRPDGSLDFVNQTWRDYTGLSLENMERHRWGSAIHPDDLSLVERAWRAHLTTGEPFHLEQRMRRADGEYRWYLISRVPLRDDNGEVIRWYGAGYDIEDHKHAVAALQRSESHLAEAERELRLIVDTIPVLVGRYRRDGSPDFVNKTARDYTGLSLADLSVARRWEVTIHPADLPLVEREWRAHLQAGEPLQIEYRLRRADGEYRWQSVRRVPLRDENGDVLGWYGAGYDIEDHKRAEVALRRSEAYLDEAQRLSHTGSFGWKAANGDVVWSKETYQILGVDRTVKPTIDVILERVHPDDRDLVQHEIDRAARGEQDYDYEHRLLASNGSVKHIHVRAHRVKHDSGEDEIVGALMDVTATREAQEALHIAQTELAHVTRITTLGEMSASIAHEVNQPLAAIAADCDASVRWLSRDVPDIEEALQAVRRMASEADRASRVIRRIRDLAKKADSEMLELDVNDVIEEAVTLVQREALSHRVTLRLQLASGLPMVRGDRIQLQQAIINLVINGVQAMATITDRARVLVIRTQPHDSGQVLVAVQDVGVGMEPANLDRLFSAFYTTKPDGMGMGLSICRSIIEAHGGRVWASRNSGPGMTFQFTVSAIDRAAVSLE